MNLLPDDDERLFGQSAQTFLSEQAGPAAWRRVAASQPAEGFDPALWEQVAQMGWTAAVLPEAHGGLEFSWKGLGLVFEAIGRHLAGLPLLSSAVLAGGALVEAGSAEQQAAWLPRLASGQARLALAVDERSRHAPQDLRTTARPDGSGWRLEGVKGFVIDGLGAQGWIVAARLAEGPGTGLFLVEAGQAGLTVEAVPMIDRRPVARLRLDGVRVGAQARLQAGDAEAALQRVLDRARLCLAAESLGVVDDVFARTVAYLKERVQFDVPIGSFQALQHRAARLYAEIELLRSTVMTGFAAVDALDPELPLLASLAKARASDLAERVCNEAVQLHGGIGVTAEYDLGLYLKRARVLAQALGDAAFHRDRYATLKGF